MATTRLDPDFCHDPVDNSFFDNHFDNTAMIPLDPLLKRLAGLPGMESGCKRLVVVLGQLGDFVNLKSPYRFFPASIEVAPNRVSEASGPCM